MSDAFFYVGVFVGVTLVKCPSAIPIITEENASGIIVSLKIGTPNFATHFVTVCIECIYQFK